MGDLNTIVFYRVEDGRVVEKGRRDLTDAARIDLHRMRVQDITADDALLGDFNEGREESDKADAFSIGSLIVQIAK